MRGAHDRRGVRAERGLSFGEGPLSALVMNGFTIAFPHGLVNLPAGALRGRREAEIFSIALRKKFPALTKKGPLGKINRMLFISSTEGGMAMITGDAAWLENYAPQLPPLIYECLKKVRAFDFAHAEDGKYPIEGCGVMSLESPSTEPAVMRRVEGHRKFIDVVYLVEGEEWIGALPLHDARGEKEALPDRDLYFYEGADDETKVYMRPGRFAVFFPEDLHRPLCAGAGGVRRIRKAVVKVPVEAL